MEARSFDEALALFELMVEDGYLHMRGMNGRWIYLTPRGFQYLEALESGGADSLQAFVAMWFDPSVGEAWRLGIAPGLRDAGYVPMRIDQKQHNNKIDDEIIAEIRRSKFLVADFTCGGDKTEAGKFQAVPRGGVYYEAGFAHGLGMEVVFTCHKDRMGDLHFDTNHFAHIVWETPKDLREQLYNRVVATVGEVRGAPGRGKGAVDPPPET
jgi:hypothetical protein